MKFVNCTQHPLTSAQRERAIEKYGITEFAEFRDLAPNLYARLAQIEPSEDLESLADDFCDWLEAQAQAGAKVAHLPIGSPGFIFVLGDVLSSRRRENYNTFPLIVFSHSRRESKDEPQEDGSILKRQVFMFEEFVAL